MVSTDYQDAKHLRLKMGLAEVFGCEPDQIDFQNDIEDTKWRNDHGKWYAKVNGIQPLPALTPELRRVCYCTTPYIVNCLIKHIPSGKYAVIGNTCIKKCGAKMIKRCPDCHVINHKRSVYCGNCRIKCSECKVYHDDNSICDITDPYYNMTTTQIFDQSIYIAPPLCTPPTITMDSSSEPQINSIPLDTSPVLRLKKHKGKTMLQVLSEDNSYIGWLLTDATATFLEPQEKLYLKTELASKVLSVGKFSHLTWTEVKRTNPDMVKWYLGKKPEYSWLNDL
jgi:hypothetical protein